MPLVFFQTALAGSTTERKNNSYEVIQIKKDNSIRKRFDEPLACAARFASHPVRACLLCAFADSASTTTDTNSDANADPCGTDKPYGYRSVI
jgi:hypothetical protein